MRATDRDRCRYRIVAVSLALILLFQGAAALNATFVVGENGTWYRGDVMVEGISEYKFSEPGFLGEPVPLAATNITVTNASGPVPFEEKNAGTITFPEGDYTVGYDAPLNDRHLTVILDTASDVTVVLPDAFSISNPLLGYTSNGASVNQTPQGTIITWEEERMVEVRFYDAFQEQMLVIFGTFWVALVVIFLVPYFLTRRKQE
ncbi:hypothetical protein AZH53_01075 [Methanomicrobiaceae archaeon CYW5]|uniref:DUF5803 family protein n=1 Tax=Methanovulcanius yangii TaxID=1789227 RepID=UPI0029C9D9F9|nr:DUF5803 family protein [Methanovulcanius yangii]MBT8507021.1 hypothetical protein [Methanovulcanius yangii]